MALVSRRRAATVWVYTLEARRSGRSVDDAWEDIRARHLFRAVEVNIQPEDVPMAILKWQKKERNRECVRVSWRRLAVGESYGVPTGAPARTRKAG